MTSIAAPSARRLSTHVVRGTDPAQLNALRRNGIDHHGLPVEPFVDPEGDWPLRCCLTDSRPGDSLAIVGWSPFPWNGAYRMTGPVVIHADICPNRPTGELPDEFEDRRQILRCYDRDHLQIYDLAVLVEPGDGLAAALDRIVADPRVELVQSFNVLAGCWSFSAVRNHPFGRMELRASGASPALDCSPEPPPQPNRPGGSRSR